MDDKRKNKILENMSKISKIVDEKLDVKSQERENITYYNDFEFEGSGLAVKDVYIVEISNQKQKETVDNPIKKDSEDNKEDDDIFATYEIYDEDNQLIATVTGDGKVHFAPEYIEQLKSIDANYFEQLNLEDINFELPEELKENDIAMTKEELMEHEKARTSKGKEEKTKNDEKVEQKENDEEEQDKEKEQETEEEKKEKTAEALDINENEIKSICTINPNDKITDKYNLIDIMPEATGYKEISIVCSNPNDKSYGKFTILGVKKDGTREQINSIEPIEGVSTSKNVISVNEDGSKVEEKQVKGLFRINARNRDDGISVSIGDYGMMDVDYVSNVMDKENRRSTPIRTRESQNQRIATAEVRENAGDSKEEMTREGEIFRDRQEDGIDPQSLDGIDTEQADGEGMTLEELKDYIKEKALDNGDMSRGEMDEFIKSEISKSGLDLSEQEIEMTTQDIEEDVIDESRFPTRGDRM